MKRNIYLKNISSEVLFFSSKICSVMYTPSLLEVKRGGTSGAILGQYITWLYNCFLRDNHVLYGYEEDCSYVKTFSKNNLHIRQKLRQFCFQKSGDNIDQKLSSNKSIYANTYAYSSSLFLFWAFIAPSLAFSYLWLPLIFPISYFYYIL